MRKFSLWAILALVLGTAFFAISCGGSSSSDDGDADANPAFTSLSDLPSSLTRVVSEDTAASISRSGIKLNRAATTGLPLGTTTSANFDADSSMAACETFNQVKSAIGQAAQGDNILCYIQAMNTAIAATGSDAWDGIDIYDGSYHVFNMNSDGLGYEEGQGPPDKVKMKITKDTNGYITDFEMYSCKDDVQDMYIHQSIGSDGTFTMDNYMNYDGGTSTGSNVTHVAGTVDSSGLFVGSKTIDVEYINSWTGEGDETGESESMMTFVQSEDSGTMSGFMNGTGGTCTFVNQAYGYFQMIDANALDTTDYDIGLLALGDGATKYALSSTCEGQPETWTSTGIDSWDGDSKGSVEDNDYTTAATAATAPDVEDVVAHTFGGNTWNCTDTAEGDIVMGELFTEGNTPEDQCEQLDWEWINCWEIIESGEGGGVETPAECVDTCGDWDGTTPAEGDCLTCIQNYCVANPTEEICLQGG